MELPEIKREEILVFRQYLIITYRSDKPCGYQIYDGATIGNNEGYFMDGQDANGKPLTYKFFLLPLAVR